MNISISREVRVRMWIFRNIFKYFFKNQILHGVRELSLLKIQKCLTLHGVGLCVPRTSTAWSRTLRRLTLSGVLPRHILLVCAESNFSNFKFDYLWENELFSKTFLVCLSGNPCMFDLWRKFFYQRISGHYHFLNIKKCVWSRIFRSINSNIFEKLKTVLL